MSVATNIFNWIGLHLSPATILFRNQQGMAKYEYVPGKPYYVAYGVGPLGGGGSDSVGWTKRIVTPDMVGKPVAIFTAIEIKTLEDKATKEQKNFIQQVRMAGGYAGFAKNREEAFAIVNPE